MSEYTINPDEHQTEEMSILNDILKTISFSDQEVSLVESDLKEHHINTPENELESQTLVEIMDDESFDENDSEYEDVEGEDDDEEPNDASVLPCISNDTSPKKSLTDNGLPVHARLRRSCKKREDDEHSEDQEDENDNQSVPDAKLTTDELVMKSEEKKEVLDDDNNTQSPAYIPRHGRYFEHDDRTLNENSRSQSEKSKRVYKDSDAKWPHDLYFRDEKLFKSRHPIPNRSHVYQEHLPSKSHTSHSEQRRDDYRRQVPYENNTRPQNNRKNHFEIKDYDRAITSNRSQRRDYDSDQVDERTFHRRRNFTNSQFQQKDNSFQLNNNSHYRQLVEPWNNHHKHHTYEERHRNFNRPDFHDNKNNLPPRLQMNRNSASTDASSTERPKRYSNIRNTMTNSFQQQTQHYQGQRSNKVEPSDWPQAPPPPTTYLPSQIIIPQIFYQQQQQTSRYVPLNYSQTSLSQQLQEKK